MKFFIGAVPPDDIKQKIADFQNHFFKGKEPPLVEPHITVKSPGGLTENMDWLEKTKEVVNNFHCFSVKFIEVGTFENEDGVVFLRPEPKTDLTALHKELLTAVDPKTYDPGAFFEDDGYNPHLTLAMGKWCSEPKIMYAIKERASELLVLPGFKVELVRIYRQKEPDQAYENFLDISLKC